MKLTISNSSRATALLIAGALGFSCLLLPGGAARTVAQTANISHGTGFATAQEAVNALIDAAGNYDEKALAAILGPSSYDILHTGEPARDKEMAAEFATQARAKQSLVSDPKHPGRMTLNVGDDSWPFPVPLVKLGGKWFFDTK